MKYLITILSVLAVTVLTAQGSTTERADRLFDRMWYKDASVLYDMEAQKLYKSTKRIDQQEFLRILKRAGDAYFFNTDMENAYKWYDILVANFYSSVEPEYIFRYAHSLQGIGKHKEAKRWMKKFSKRTRNKDDRSERLNQEKLTVDHILDIEAQFTLKNVAVNTKFSDFGVAYYKDDIVYSSAIDTSNFHTRIYHWNEQPFLDMYLGDLNEIESDMKLKGEFSEDLNTRYHEATLAFSPDYNRVYFTRNNYDGDLHRDDNGINHLKLYMADMVKGEDSKMVWSEAKELPFNSEDYSVGHPAVSADGKKLYFVSDMPGSIGATDIFVVDILDTDSKSDAEYIGFSKPRNLGKEINTAGREMFPFVTDKALYFSSDGHLGLGALDVFISTFGSGKYNEPKNLGAPLNSELDDFGFIVKEDLDIGFVCSNRETGRGDDDIYSFVRIPPPEAPPCEQLIRGYVSDAVTGERIAKITMKLLDQGGQVLSTTKTDISGAYVFDKTLDCGSPYKVIAEKTGYEIKNKPVITLDESGETIVALGLESINELIVEEAGVLKIKIGVIYFDLDKSYIRKNDAAIELNKIVLLMTEYPNMVIQIESHTDSRHSYSYNMSLADRRAKSTREYLIGQGISPKRILNAKGYGESQLINRCKDGVPCSEIEHQFNRRSEFIIVKM